MDLIYPDLGKMLYQSILEENGFLDLVKLYDAVNKTQKIQIFLFIQDYNIQELYIRIYLECLGTLADELEISLFHQFKTSHSIPFDPNYETKILNQILNQHQMQEIDLIQGSQVYHEVLDTIQNYEWNQFRNWFHGMSFRDFKKFITFSLTDLLEPYVRQDHPALREFNLCLRKKFRYLLKKFNINVDQERKLR